MKTERGEVRTVAQRWKNTYLGKHGVWSYGPDKEAIYRKLLELDVETATAEDVKAIIGNSSWVEPWKCTECGTNSWSVVEMGEEPEYESHTSYACKSCLLAAVELAP